MFYGDIDVDTLAPISGAKFPSESSSSFSITSGNFGNSCFRSELRGNSESTLSPLFGTT